MASLSPLQGSLGHRRAAHLLRRTSYHYTKDSVDKMALLPAAEAVSALLALRPLQLDQPVYSATDDVPPVTWINPPGTPLPTGTQDFMMRPYLRGWWIHEALKDDGIGHKMSFFFHQFFATSMIGTGLTNSYFDYLALLRWGAIGNFKKLATKIVLDNTMLRYLNNNENTAANPNENFAREYFELFTIGKGPQIGPGDYTNYTEDDIVAAARVLTGFRVRGQRDTIDPETGIPMGRAVVGQHDSSIKVFSDKFQGTVIQGSDTQAGMFTELNNFVDMIFAQPETAKNLCRRLYRYFIYREITSEIENDVIAPLSDTLISNNFEIKPVLAQLLESEHFFDADDSNVADEIVGGMIKSPLELALQSISFFDVQIPDPLTLPRTHYRLFYEQAITTRMFGAANLPIFLPSDVAGYPGLYSEPELSRQWFNSSTIVARYKVPAMLLTGTRQFGGGINQPIGVKLNIAPWVKDSGFFTDPSDPYLLVQELLAYMLPEEVDTDRFNYFYIKVFLDELPPADWTYEWQNYLTTGNETEVKLALERLINAVMYSPEYQTF